MKKGLVVLKKAVSADPSNYHALTLLGRIYLTLVNPTKARSYLTKSLEHNKSQPIAIALIAICYALKGDLKVSYKILEKAIKEYKELKNEPEFAILLPTVRAMISYLYEREKKGFNAYYEKYRIVASIGNNSKNRIFICIVTMEDLDEDESSDEEAYSSDDEAKVEDSNFIQRRGTLIEKRIKTKVRHEEDKEENVRHSIISNSDISIDMRTDKSGNFK